jgi:PKD repeat protein
MMGGNHMKQGGKFFITLPLIACVVFFCGLKTVLAAPDIIISEVAWMGTASSSFAEWLELANVTPNDVALDGWILKARSWSKAVALTGSIRANSYYLLERTRDETLPAISADLVYTGELKNAGDSLELKDASGVIIDMLDATAGWPGGDNVSKATLERSSDLAWATSSVPGGTPKATNSVQLIIILPPPGPVASDTPDVSVTPGNPAANSVPISLPKALAIHPGEVVINEILSDPLDGQPEWLEIYLVADRTIDLAGATIEDGSQAQTHLTGILSPANRFAIIENPNGNLNNAGDMIILRDGNKAIVDQVAYGDWGGGQFNAPVARDGSSLARRFDGVNTYNAASDWAVTIKTTKQAANQIVSAEGETAAVQVDAKALVISEILPDPLGDESGEFVEIYNQSEEAVSLGGWRLLTKSGQIYKFGSTTVISAHSYKTFYRRETKLALANDNGGLKLLPPDSSRASFSVNYKDGEPGQSYAREADGAWHWTESPTPGAANKISQKNQPPVISIYAKSPVEVGEPAVFDSSDTFDPEDDRLQFNWRFGDGASSSLANPEHSYDKPGSYKVMVTASDGQNQSSKIELIKVVKRTGAAQAGGPVSNQSSLGNVYINEALPNPIGSDDSEFIEIFNSSPERVSLLGWSLDDGPDGSNPYKISEEIIIEPREYLLFERAETDLALNNNADEIRLFDVSGRLADATNYQKAAEGASWGRTPAGKFIWSEVPTPGSANIISVAAAKAKSGAKRAKSGKIASAENEVGDEAVFQCVATSLPGQLASQYFYCENDRGWQIYNYKKDFPSLAMGDLLEVRGVVAQSNGNWRLKIKNRESIRKLGRKNLAVSKINLEDLGAAHFGKLVRVHGEITKKLGSSFYLDDNTAEGQVQLKASAGLVASNIGVGEEYDITGVVQGSQSGAKILPRSREDVRRQRAEAVLGDLATGTQTTLAAPSRVQGYAVVAGSGTVLIFGLWLMRKMGMKF